MRPDLDGFYQQSAQRMIACEWTAALPIIGATFGPSFRNRPASSAMPQGESVSESGPRPINVVVLGSTGSVGRSAVDVLERDAGHRLKAFGLAAHSSVGRLIEQARKL